VSADKHRCPLPNIGTGPLYMERPPWTCGVCGRVFAVGQWGWIEIQGPSHE
jgi:hypothetical protein